MSNYICKEEQVIIVLLQIFVLDLKILQTLLFFICKNCTCCCSVIKSCLTVYNSMVCNIPGYLLAYSYLPEFAAPCYLPYFSQIHVHWSMMISIYLILCCPLLHLPSIFSNISLYQWVGSLYQVAKILELHQQFFQWIFRVDFISDWLIWSPWNPRDSQEFPVAPAAAAKSLQSCLTLCDPIDSSPPGSAVPGVLQARTLEWVAISFSAWKWKVKVKSLSLVRLLATPWTATYQVPPPMWFSRQEYWSGLPLPSPHFQHHSSKASILQGLAFFTLQVSYPSMTGGKTNTSAMLTFFNKMMSLLFQYTVSVQFSHSVVSHSLWPHGLQHSSLPCPLPTPGACANPFQSSQWCPLIISSSVIPFSSCLQSFPASGSFPMSQFINSGGQGIGTSASVLPMSTQDWFSLELTGLLSLQSKGLSRAFSNITVQKHLLALSFLYSLTLTFICD